MVNMVELRNGLSLEEETVSILETLEQLEGHRELTERFAAFRTLLALPPDVELFYAFGSARDGDDCQKPKQPRCLLLEPKTEMWWRDYSADPWYRLRDPVRRVVRRGFQTIVWRDIARRSREESNGEELWRRVWNLGIQAGVTVPIHDATCAMYGSVAVVSFGDRREFEDWYAGARDALPAQAYYFHHGLAEDAEGRAQSAAALSKRECECLTLVAKGASSKEIARQLDISFRTVDLHIARAARRLSARNRIEAVALALKCDLLAL